MDEYPPLVIIILTWEGPAERDLREARLRGAKRGIESIREHLVYPNYSWHIADDGSSVGFQYGIVSLLEGDEYTFSDTRTGGDVGMNINLGYEAAFRRADLALLWHDDRYLRRELDLRPYAELLTQYDDVCQVRLKPKRPLMEAHPVERCGETWWWVHKFGQQRHAVDIGPHVSHRRFRDYYGPYPVGLRPDICEDEMSWRFRWIGQHGGPDVFCHDSRWLTTEISWGEESTWEWRVERERDESTRFRSYGTTRAQAVRGAGTEGDGDLGDEQVQGGRSGRTEPAQRGACDCAREAGCGCELHRNREAVTGVCGQGGGDSCERPVPAATGSAVPETGSEADSHQL